MQREDNAYQVFAKKLKRGPNCSLLNIQNLISYFYFNCFRTRNQQTKNKGPFSWQFCAKEKTADAVTKSLCKLTLPLASEKTGIKQNAGLFFFQQLLANVFSDQLFNISLHTRNTAELIKNILICFKV